MQQIKKGEKSGMAKKHMLKPVVKDRLQMAIDPIHTAIEAIFNIRQTEYLHLSDALSLKLLAIQNALTAQEDLLQIERDLLIADIAYDQGETVPRMHLGYREQ
jgi:hypothetical protein